MWGPLNHQFFPTSLCVGFLFLVLYPAASFRLRLLPPPPPHTACSHTPCPHTSCPHTSCHHTSCRHTPCPHQLVLTHLVLTNLSSHNLSSHTLFTHNLLTHTLSSPALCVAGVALGDTHLRFAWQAWHSLTSTFTLRGRRGTYGTGRRATLTQPLQ